MSHRRIAPGKESKLSADQSPPSPAPGTAPGTEPVAGTLPGLPRLFFPEEPAVPPQGPPPTQAPVTGMPPAGLPPGLPPPPPPGLPPPPSGLSPPSGGWQAPPGWQPTGWQPPGVQPAPARAQRPTEQPRRELRHRAAAAMIFGLLSLLSLSAANEVSHVGYLITFAVVIGLAALVLGASAARRARLEGTMRPRGSVVAIILGSVSIVLAVVALVGLVFAHELTNYEQCLNNAHGSAAQQVCTRQLMHAIQHHFGEQG